MKRVYIICEGQSEETFVKHILSQHFENLQIYLTPIIIPTSRKQKGGGLNYDRVKFFITNKFKQDKEAFVSTFFDYYALPNDFPKYDEQVQCNDIYQKIDILEQGFCDDINHQRFFPHIQPYEFESLLFSDIDKIIQADAEWRNNQSCLNELKKIIQDFNNPELINNSPQTSPSHRLKNIFPRYRKVTHGRIIAQNITITHIRNKCKHFDEWCKKISSV